MAVQQEIKSQLAKLLATEDLVVEHRQVPTAQFDVHTRVLTLPVWEKASHTVYDLLVGHEVGHALFTPDEDWTLDITVPQQFVNVVEDARIEKLMKRKYMGIAKTFYNGYNELHSKDFFEIKDEDITTFNLADRANLYFKVGNYIDVVFSSDEKQIISIIEKCETFSDTKKAALVLYEYCKKQQEQEAKIDLEQQSKQGQLDFGELSQTEQEGEKEELETSPQPTPQMEASTDSGGELPEQDFDSSAPEVQTAESFNDNLQSLINTHGSDSVYVEIPKLHLDKVIVDNAEIHTEIDLSFLDQQQHANQILEKEGLSKDLYKEVDADYIKFKRSAQKEVNYLVKEFECRKAADNYARATTSRTGVLDTTKLQTYRFNEDLFKKVTVIPDGKNHGLVFVLDWSGSMSSVLEDTLKQLYNLIWFCKKVNIPFEVYAFTNEWLRNSGKVVHSRYEKKEYQLVMDNTFSLMNLLSSKVNAKTLDHQMLNIWRVGLSFYNKYYCYYKYPEKLSLSGTPLNEALMTLHQVLPQFQKDNKVQKVQCIVLTDGEANYMPYHKKVQRFSDSEKYMGCRSLDPAKSYLRDRKLGKTYKFGWNYHEFTDVLLNNLRDKFPTVNFIGMRVLANRDAMRFVRLYNPEGSKEFDRLQKDWKKMKSFIIKTSGYDAYFALSSSNLADDAEFEVNDDATKAQIKRAFVKSLKVKKLNKKVLSEFISLVA